MDVTYVASRSAESSLDHVIAKVADLQHGLITTTQLRRIGLSPSGFHSRVRRGWLFPVRRGVYAVGRRGGDPHSQILAAVLAVRPALASHDTALALWGALPLCDGPWHVSTPTFKRRREGMVVHEASLSREDLCAIDSIPVTAPARSLLDFAASGQPELERTLDELRAARLVGARGLGRLRDRTPGHQGWKPLRALLAAEAEPGFSRSEAERRMRALIREAELERPRRNVKVGGWEVDCLWPEGRLVVEVDGYAFHSSPSAFERDRRKQADLQDLGYEVLRFTWRQLTNRQLWVVARLASALARRRP